MAGVQVGVGFVDIRPDLKSFGQELNRGMSRELSGAAEKASSQLKSGLGDVAKVAVGAFAGVKIADFLKGTVAAASDLNEAVNVTGLTFGDARGEIDRFVKSAAGIGLSERSARELTASLGGLLKNLGLSTDQTVSWSKRLTQLGSDLGSAFNADPAEAVQAIGAALRGETEPIRRFNVVLDDATVKQKAVELGLARSTSEVSRQAKTMATLALITEQTKDAQGDFANTADGLANSQRQLAANMENLKASLGQALLPVVARGTGAVNDLLGVFNELPGPVREAAAGLVLLTGAISAAGIAAAVLGPKIAAARLELEGMGAAGLLANRSIGAVALLGKAVGAVAIPVGIAAALNSQINKMTGDMKKLADVADNELLPTFDKMREGRNLWQRFVEFANDTPLDQAAENVAVFRKVIESGDLALAKRILTAARGRPVEKELQQVWDEQVTTIRTLNQDQQETARILQDITGAAGDTTETIETLGNKMLGLVSEQRQAEQASRAVARADQDLAAARADLNQLLKAGAVDEEKVAGARERLGEATRSLGHANRQLARAQQDYDEALAAAKILGTDTANDKLVAAADSLADAQDSVTDATDRQNDARKELAAAQAGDPDYQDKLAAARRRVEDATTAVTDAEYTQAQQTLALKAATDQANTALAGHADLVQKLRDEWTKTIALDPAVAAFLGRALTGLPPGYLSPDVAPLPPGAAGPILPGQVRLAGPPAPAATATSSTKNVTVNNYFNERPPDPAYLGKMIAWQL